MVESTVEPSGPGFFFTGRFLWWLWSHYLLLVCSGFGFLLGLDSFLSGLYLMYIVSAKNCLLCDWCFFFNCGFTCIVGPLYLWVLHLGFNPSRMENTWKKIPLSLQNQNLNLLCAKYYFESIRTKWYVHIVLGIISNLEMI